MARIYARRCNAGIDHNYEQVLIIVPRLPRCVYYRKIGPWRDHIIYASVQSNVYSALVYALARMLIGPYTHTHTHTLSLSLSLSLFFPLSFPARATSEAHGRNARETVIYIMAGYVRSNHKPDYEICANASFGAQEISRESYLNTSIRAFSTAVDTIM